MTDALVAAAARRMLPVSLRWTEAPPPGAPAAGPVLVEFGALGPVEAVVGGRMVDLGAPKQRALLALLVSGVGQRVPVDAMLEALWAGHPPPSATTSLQAYVANLRRVLEPDRAPRTPATVLRTCPGGYLLDSRVVGVDVHRFGEHATAGWQAWERGDPQQALTEFEAGLGLWRGQAYAEVAGASSVVPEVARLEELQLSVVEARCAALLAVGAHELAVAELEAFVQAHPLREYGCELLSLALYRAGRQADALGVLRTMQKQLADELGIDPRPALQHLEREILNQVPALDWQPVSPVPTPAGPAAAPVRVGGPAAGALVRVGGPAAALVHVGGPAAAAPVRVGRPAAGAPVRGPAGADADVFVGRAAALGHLLEALAGADAGRGQVVTVSGEPGIGKTSLLRRFAELAGVPVLRGTCPEHVAGPPLWPWEQVLRAAARRFPQHPLPGPVAELIDGDTGHLARGAEVAGAALRQFEAIVHYLTEAPHPTPTVVLIDHLHRADPSSLRLLAHLAESVPASRVLLAVSYRSDEAADLAGTLAALARSGMTRIELTGLSAQETRTLAGTLARREVGPSTADALWARTEGNPFFLQELVRSVGDQCLDRAGAAPVPAPVREVVLRRISRLPRATTEVLSVAAVAGRHFDVHVVAEAASVGIEAALESLEPAVAAGLVVEDQQRLGWFRFTHAMTADALYGTTGRLRRARLHRQIGATASRAWGGNAGRAAEVARHWLLAAELDPTAAAHAVTHAATAARAADARLAFEDAAALWRQALAAADLAEPADVDRFPLLVRLGTSLHRAGRPQDGLPHFIEALEDTLATHDARGDPDSSRLVTAAVAAVSELDRHPARPAAGGRLVDVVERALAHVTDHVQRGLMLSCLAAARRHDGDPANGPGARPAGHS